MKNISVVNFRFTVLLWAIYHVTAAIYSPCSCPDPFSTCGDGDSCVCQVGYYHPPDSDSCIAAFRSSCVSSSECIDRNLSNAVCTQGRCQCNIGYFYPGQLHRTNCFEAFGSTCQSNDECRGLLSDSECTAGQCKCSYGYYYKHSTVGCTRVYSAQCVGNNDCAVRGGDNYKCGSDRSCECVDNFYLSSHICVPIEGSHCSSHEDCVSRGQGQYVCDVEGTRLCFAPCDNAVCKNNGTCVVDTQTTSRGYQCHCVSPHAGMSCGHTENAVVKTRLKFVSTENVAGKEFLARASAGLLNSIILGLCGRNKACTELKEGQLDVKIPSAKKENNKLILTYMVMDGTQAVNSADVVKTLTSLSPQEMDIRMGYTVELPAAGIVEVPPAAHCLIRWGFASVSYITEAASDGLLRALEQKLSSLIHQLLTTNVYNTPERQSISSKILKHAVISDVVTILFATFKDSTCLPALSVTRLVRTISLNEITPILGLVPVSYPTESFFTLDSYVYYRNAFVLDTQMEASKTEVYFALNWNRLEQGLSRVISHAINNELDSALHGRPIGREKRDSFPANSMVTARLLDIRRNASTNIVHLVAYAERLGVVIPVHDIVYYLEKTSHDDIAIMLRELIPAQGYVTAYDSAFVQQANLAIDEEVQACVPADSRVSNKYLIRTALKMAAANKAELVEEEVAAIKAFRQFVVQLASPYSELSPPRVCVQIMKIRRLSYDTGYVELIYFVTVDNSPVPADDLKELSTYLSIDEIRNLIGGENAEGKSNTVMPYLHPLQPTGAYSSAGTEFIVAFMENYVEADWLGQRNYSLKLYFTMCGPKAAQVTVEAPKYKPHFRRVLQVHPGSHTSVVIPQGLIVKATTVAFNSILVTSTQPINVMAVNRDYLTHDATLVLPVSQLGTEYTTASFSSEASRSQLAVAAYTDSTVYIQLPRQANGMFQRFTLEEKEYIGNISLRLSAMEVLQIQLFGDISGARVTSDKPVAVFSGNVVVAISDLSSVNNYHPSRDHLYEQLLPTAYAGVGFIVAVPQVEVAMDPPLVKVISTQANTLICFPSRDKTIHLSTAGTSFQLALAKRDYAVYLYSDKPIKVFQFSQSAQIQSSFGDPSLLEVIPLHIQMNYYVFVVPDEMYRNFLRYLVLVIEEDKRDGLRLDGQPMPTSRFYWHAVEHTTPTMSMYSIELNIGVYRIWHVDQRVSFTANLYGFAIKESYSLRAGSCDSRYLSQYYPLDMGGQSGGPTEATAPQNSPEEVVWPISTPSRPMHSSVHTTLPVEWVSRNQPTTVPQVPISKVTIGKTPTTSSKTTITTSTTTTSKGITTSFTAPSATRATSIAPSSSSAYAAPPAVPQTAKPRAIPTEVVDTTPSLAVDKSAPATITSAATPNETYWLKFALGEPNRSLTGEERHRIEEVLVDLYTKSAVVLRRVERAEETGDQGNIQATVVNLERHHTDTLVVFYIQEDGSPVPAAAAVESFVDVSAANLTELTGIFVTQPVSAYVTDSGGDGNILEAAENVGSSEGSNNLAFIPAVLLAVVGCVGAASGTYLIAKRQSKAHSKQIVKKQMNGDGYKTLKSLFADDAPGDGKLLAITDGHKSNAGTNQAAAGTVCVYGDGIEVGSDEPDSDATDAVAIFSGSPGALEVIGGDRAFGTTDTIHGNTSAATPGGTTVATRGGTTVATRGGNTVATRGGTTVAIRDGNTVATRGGTTVVTPGGNTVASPDVNTVAIRGSNTVATHGGTSVATHGDYTVATRVGTTVATPGDQTVATLGGKTVATHGGTSVATHGDYTVATRVGTTVATPGDQTVATLGGKTVATSDGTTVATRGQTTVATPGDNIACTYGGTTSSIPGGAAAVPTTNQSMLIHAPPDGEEGHGDGTQNTTASELITDTVDRYGQDVIVEPEYPMTLSIKEVDEIFAPYVMAHNTRSEAFSNKKSVYGRKNPYALRHRGSESGIDMNDVVRQIPNGYRPKRHSKTSHRPFSIASVSKDKLTRKSSDHHWGQKIKKVRMSEDSPTILNATKSDLAINPRDEERVATRTLYNGKLKKHRLREKRSETFQRHSRLDGADRPLGGNSANPVITRNAHLQHSSSSNSLPGSVCELQSSEYLCPLPIYTNKRRLCGDDKSVLLKKAKRRMRRHLQQLSSDTDIPSTKPRRSVNFADLPT